MGGEKRDGYPRYLGDSERGRERPRFGRVPEIESFAKSENETKLLTLCNRYPSLETRWAVPYTLPPGTPKDRVMILQDAMRRAFKDPDFHREYKKLTGEDPDPLMPEEMEKAIKEMPRDAEVIDLLKKLSDEGPLPTR